MKFIVEIETRGSERFVTCACGERFHMYGLNDLDLHLYACHGWKEDT